MHVEEDPSGDESLMDLPQGVHDALRLDSSQRPAEERDVEPLARYVECSCVRDPELDPVCELVGERARASPNRLLLGIDAENFRGLVGIEPGQATVAAADLEHALAVEVASAARARASAPRGSLIDAIAPILSPPSVGR